VGDDDVVALNAGSRERELQDPRAKGFAFIEA